MIARRRFLITATAACHLLFALSLLTPPLPAQTAPPTGGILSSARAGEPVTIHAIEQEKVGDMYYLHGDAEILFRNYTLRATEITYNDQTGDSTASGNVQLTGGPHDVHIAASHCTYNVNTEHGRFYDVVGTTGVKMHGRSVVLTSSNPFSFTGEVVDRLGPDLIVVHHGVVTSCTLPHPHWSLTGRTIKVVPGQNAHLYSSVFFLWRLPLFYFPFVDHPTERLARESGFLIPSGGTSSLYGQTIGDSFFWAISPSADATVGAELLSERGWSQRGSFRWLFGSSDSSGWLAASYYGVQDHGISTVLDLPGPDGTVYVLPPHTGAGGEDVRLIGMTNITPDVRAVADLNYVNSFLFRATFAETYAQAINTEVRNTAFVSDNWQGYSFNLLAARYEDFQSFAPGDLIKISHLPSLEATTVDRQLGHSPFYWNFDTSLDGLARSDPAPGTVVTGYTGRSDLAPGILLPLFWRGWSLRPEVTLRDTPYSNSLPLNAAGAFSGGAVNRHAIENAVEVRPPSLDRIFDTPVASHQLKHVFEPYLIYRLTAGVDNYSRIPLFDAADILSDTNEVEYGFVNRLYSKKMGKGCVPAPTAGAAAPGASAPASAAPSTPAGQAPPSGQPPTTAPGASSSISPGQAVPFSAAENAIQAKVSAPAAAPVSGPCVGHEIFSWGLTQKYFFDPTFGGAIVAGRRNVFTTTEELSGISFLTGPRNLSPIVSRMQVRAPGATIDWQLDYDPVVGSIGGSNLQIVETITKDVGVNGGYFYLQTPGEFMTTSLTNTAALVAAPDVFNQFRAGLNYGRPSKRGFTAAGTFGFDAQNGYLQYTMVQTTYNLDCCGFTLEYRRFALGTVRNENEFYFSLFLANVGTFGNLRRQERLY